MSNVGGEKVHGLHPAVNQDPPLALELLPVNALPRTNDRNEKRRQRDSPLEEEAITLPEADSLQEFVNDITPPAHSVHENAMANEIRPATSEELLCSPEKEKENDDANKEKSALAEVVSKDVSLKGKSFGQVKTSEALTMCEEVNFDRKGTNEDVGCEINPVKGQEISDEIDLNSEVDTQSNVDRVKRASLEEMGDEGKATKAVDEDVKVSRGRDFVSCEEALSNDFEHTSNISDVNACKSENSVHEKNGRGVQSHRQSAQEGAGCANVAILLAATSDRRKLLDKVCRRAGGGVGEGHHVGKQGSCGVAICGQEMMYFEQSAHRDMS